jgi:tetratricopeptide (TPR) repeat protein
MIASGPQPMNSESVAFGIAGIAFGLVAGWVIGSQQAGPRGPAPVAVQTAAPATPGTPSGAAPAAVLDQTQVQALTAMADRDPASALPRVQLGNLYYDAERYEDAIKWYSEALRLAPDDVNVSTDLGVSYYYTNQPDRALAQFDHSLKIDPRHAKTLLNVGIVKAFVKQDLEGAAKAWEQVIQLTPDSPEGQAAKRALDGVRAAHPTTGGGAAAKPGA